MHVFPRLLAATAACLAVWHVLHGAHLALHPPVPAACLPLGPGDRLDLSGAALHCLAGCDLAAPLQVAECVLEAEALEGPEGELGLVVSCTPRPTGGPSVAWGAARCRPCGGVEGGVLVGSCSLGYSFLLPQWCSLGYSFLPVAAADLLPGSYERWLAGLLLALLGALVLLLLRARGQRVEMAEKGGKLDTARKNRIRRPFHSTPLPKKERGGAQT